MPELTPDMAEAVSSACRANADEAAGALSRALDQTFSLAVGEAKSYSAAELPADLDEGPGLAVVLAFGDTGMIGLLPEATQYVPDWCADPDPTGTSKLSTLAQELGMLLVPEDLIADEFAAVRVANMRETLARGGIGDEAVSVPLALSADETDGILHLLWPLKTAKRVMQPDGTGDSEDSDSEPPDTTTIHASSTIPPANPADSTPPARKFHLLSDGDFKRLPSYTRSLFKIQVPVTVSLASKKMPIGDIIALGPGSIVQFDKSYDEMLDMNIGNRRIAEGEVVKVGDNYGLRITSITMPEERFMKVCRAS